MSPEHIGVRSRLRRLLLQVLPDLTPWKSSRDFRILMISGAITSFGSFLTYVSVPYQIMQLTGSKFLVGLVGLVGAAVIRARDALVINPGDGIASATDTGNNDANIQQLATNLYGDHVFAFQLTSVLLIVAVAGTVLLTRKWPKDAPDTESSDS